MRCEIVISHGRNLEAKLRCPFRIVCQHTEEFQYTPNSLMVESRYKYLSVGTATARPLSPLVPIGSNLILQYFVFHSPPDISKAAKTLRM